MADLLARVFLMRGADMTDDPISSVPMTIPTLRDLERIPDPPSMAPLGDYTQEVFDCICSGWSNGMVIAYLRDHHEFTPALTLIQEYRELIPPEIILPSTALQRHFAGLRVMVDPLVDMQMILRLEHERLSSELHVEQLADEKKLSHQVDARLRSYWKHLKEFAELTGQASGHIPSEVETGIPLVGKLFITKATETRTRLQVEINAPQQERRETDTELPPAPLLERGTG